MLIYRLVIFLIFQFSLFIYITAYIDRDYELLFVLIFIPVFSDDSGYLSGYSRINVTDVEVHHSASATSSGSSTSSWNSALRLVFWMNSFLFFINICVINVLMVNFLFRCDVFVSWAINKND